MLTAAATMLKCFTSETLVFILLKEARTVFQPPLEPCGSATVNYLECSSLMIGQKKGQKTNNNQTQTKVKNIQASISR